MSKSEHAVREVAKRLCFEELDTRAFTSLESFLESIDEPESLSDQELKGRFLDFESKFYNLELLEGYENLRDSLNISSVMNRNILTVQATDSATEVAARLTRRMITGQPVVDRNGQLCGVISVTDFAGLVARPELVARLSELKVGDIMTKYPITATVKSELLEVLHLMMSFRLHRIIIVDEHRRPVGIITSLDVTKIFREILKSTGRGGQVAR